MFHFILNLSYSLCTSVGIGKDKSQIGEKKDENLIVL